MAATKEGVSNYDELVGDYKNPLLQPWAAEIVRKNGEIARTGDSFPTAHNQCWPEPPPYILGNQQLQVLQRKGQVVLMYSHSAQVRHVRLNGAHPATVTPSASGDSIGHYEAGTLVVDTVGFEIGRVATVDQFGTPHSEALHVVERYRLIPYEAARAAQEGNVRANGGTATEQAAAIDPGYKGQGLQVQFTVEDKNVFTMPWSGLATYRKAGTEWGENVCAENIHEYYSNSVTDVPQAENPDF
jgi:hypothetical protein